MVRKFSKLSKLSYLFLGMNLLLSQVLFASPLEKNLVVGMELSYPPFEMTDAQGVPSGVSVELAKALAQHLKRELKIENMSFDGLIPSLKTGKIDLIISSMTATEEREKSIDFSTSYLKTGLALLLNSKSSAKSISDLDASKKIIVVKKGTTGHQYASKNLTLATIHVLDKESSCVLEVIQGKADAFIYDSMSVYQNHKRNLDTTKAILTPFKEEFWAIGIRKGNSELKKSVDEFLINFKQAKGFEVLGDKFLKEEKDYFQKNHIPFYF